MGAVAGTVFPVILEAAVRATPLLIAAWLGSRALRRRRAALRHGTWGLAFAGLLVLPAVMTMGPSWEIPGLPGGGWGWETGAVLEAHALEAAPAGGIVRQPDPSPISRGSPERFPPLMKGAALAWALGVLLLWLRLIGGVVMGARLLARSAPAKACWTRSLREVESPCSRARRVRLVTVEGVDTPQTWGVVAPVVVVPRDSGRWGSELRRSVLLHELNHVRRLDSLTVMTAAVVAAVYWFHPMVWVGLAAIRREMESACDEAVLLEGVSAPVYAAHLVEVARWWQRRPALPLLALGGPGELERRVRAVLDPSKDRMPARRRTIAAVGSLACAWTLIGATARSVPDAPAARGLVLEAPSAFRWVETGLDPVRIIDVALEGRVILSPDTTAVIGGHLGSTLRIEERSPSGVVSRVATASFPAGSSRPEWSWGGESGEPSDRGEVWLSALLPRVLRHARTWTDPRRGSIRGADDGPVASGPLIQDGASFHHVVRGATLPILSTALRPMGVPEAVLEGAVERTAAALWLDLAITLRPPGDVQISTGQGPFERVLPELVLWELESDGVVPAPGDGEALRASLSEAGRSVEASWKDVLQQGM